MKVGTGCSKGYGIVFNLNFGGGVDDPVMLHFSSADFEMIPTSKEIISANYSCKYSLD